MLDKNSLSQLKQLKQQIEDDKEFADGIVKGTQRKFGFLVTADNREIYLPPDEMQKVFPGDRIRIQVFTEKGKNNSSKARGEIKKLLDSPLKSFAGRYVVKGKGHFVEPDLPNLSRWIFIPPAARNGAKEGDYIYCQLTRHAYPQAKPQAKVLEVIGPADRSGIEADYIVSKFQLDPGWPEDWDTQLSEIDLSSREDLSQIPFITIDAATTQDMDDALYATANDQGWLLQVAIADPSATLTADSALEKLIQHRATSVYLPGRPTAMLPDGLANDRCSLLAAQPRPALVCTLQINSDGSIDSAQFSEAQICSQAKLSYQQVAAFLDQQQADADCQAHAETLNALQAVTQALLDNRRREHLVIPGRQDYRLVLNDQKKLERIEPISKSSAHQLVEECMIATNRSAAEFMGDSGLFIEHPGFRPERLPDVKKLAEEQLSLTDIAFETPQGYRQLMNSIDDDALEFPLRAVLSRLLERSRLSTTPKPHYGMGLSRYTTITSPIRKYSDLLAHRMIKAKLRGETVPSCPDSLLQSLQSRQDNARQASYQMEQWLKCQYLEPLTGQHCSGEVTQVNSNGFTVRLAEHLIEGFVETRQLDEKYSFDPMRLRLKSKSQTIELGQTLEVTIAEVDSKQRRIRFTLSAQAARNEEAAQA